jgi:hypothetical protein
MARGRRPDPPVSAEARRQLWTGPETTATKQLHHSQDRIGVYPSTTIEGNLNHYPSANRLARLSSRYRRFNLRLLDWADGEGRT